MPIRKTISTRRAELSRHERALAQLQRSQAPDAAAASDAAKEIVRKRKSLHLLQFSWLSADAVCKISLEPESENDDPMDEETNTVFIEDMRLFVVVCQQNFLVDKATAMQDFAVREAFWSFVKSEQRRAAGRMRLIRALMWMDAELVFTLVAQTRSTVHFALGAEEIILCFNGQFCVHPSALEQMAVDGAGKPIDDLLRVLVLTKEYSDGLHRDEDYLALIGGALKTKYRMITQAEIEQLERELNDRFLVCLGAEQRRHFMNLKPEEAYRLRTVLHSDDLDSRLVHAAIVLAERRGVARNIHDVAACIEIMKIFVASKVSDAMKADEVRVKEENIKSGVSRKKAEAMRKADEANKQLEAEYVRRSNAPNANTEELVRQKDEQKQRNKTEAIATCKAFPGAKPMEKEEIHAIICAELVNTNGSRLQTELNEEIDNGLKLMHGHLAGGMKYCSDLVAFYHEYKHGGETLRAYDTSIENASAELQSEVYHVHMPERIIAARHFKGHLVSQYGHCVAHRYEMNRPHKKTRNQKPKYLGITHSARVPGATHRGWDDHVAQFHSRPSLATHYCS